MLARGVNGGLEAYGGSQPLPPHGWQRQIRLMPRQAPRTAPYFRTASIKYWLQVG